MTLAKAIEEGRYVARDIGGSDPERMAAPRVVEYVREVFQGTNVKIEVVKGQSLLEKEYPCFATVNRCATQVDRHGGCIIWLTYELTGGDVDETLMLVGKGVTYDTGGADIKAGVIMAGMSIQDPLTAPGLIPSPTLCTCSSLSSLLSWQPA